MNGLIRSAGRLIRSLPRRASAIAATLLLLVMLGVLAASGTFEGSGTEEFSGLGRPEIRSLALGTAHSEVERRLGRGQDALEYGHTGTALEPMDASCEYYPAGGAYPYDVVQLCYRDDALVSKKTFTAPRVG